MSESKLLVELRDVSMRYQSVDGGEGPLILKGINMEVLSGEATAIVGPSGSGKSTLLNIIGLLDVATEGEVKIDGRDVKELSAQEQAKLRNESIGWVFQSHHLLPQCNVMENVLLPQLAGHNRVGDEAKNRAEQLLERVGLGHRLTHRPGQLSGGEQQRVAVVRALINEPRLLMADEPTGALDEASSENLISLLLELNAEMDVTLLVVTHSMEVAERMGKVLNMRDGQLVSEGAGV